MLVPVTFGDVLV